MLYPGFIGASYQSQAVTADNEECWNWYPEQLQSTGATAKSVLYPTPGVVALSTGTVGSGRAHYFNNGREFAVIGDTFYEIDSVGARTSRGTVALDGNPATIVSNGQGGDQIFVTSGGNGYLFDLTTNAFTTIAALAGKATMGDMLDGYFLALDAATSTLYISTLLDGSVWNTGSDFAQRSLAPDPWISMKVVGRNLWLFGEVTSEVWYDTGASFPFAPQPSPGVIGFGIAAPFSPKQMGQDVVWLASTRGGHTCVVRAVALTPTVISSYPLESALDTYTPRVNEAVGDVYAERGHIFYNLSFDANDVTWSWDQNTQLWAKRGTWLPTESRYVSWRPRFYAWAFGQHRVLDAFGASIYRMGSDLNLDVDELLIRRLRRAPAITNENQRVFYGSFELDLEPGLGNALPPGDDPQVMLRISNDAGKTWISEQWRSAGKQGQFSRRVRWTRLGAARRRCFEVVVTDPVPYRLTGAYLEMAQQQQAANQ